MKKNVVAKKVCIIGEIFLEFLNNGYLLDDFTSKRLLLCEKKYKTYFLELFGVLIIAFENYVLVVDYL